MGAAILKKKSPARERLLETADQLFYREGIRAVGIDRVIAEAGVAKMTLYAHFKSKEELVLAVLQRREQAVTDFFRAGIERHSARGKPGLEAFFAALKDWLELPDFRGCAFLNATVELADPTHPGVVYARSQRSRFNSTVHGLLADSIRDLHNAEEMFPAILLLLEGAIVTAQMYGDSGAADTAWAAARKLLES